MFELSLSNITLIIGILSIIFSVFLYFKNPQIDIEKKQAINEERDKGKSTIVAQQAVENKAQLLAQQVQWEKESSDKRFTEMGKRIDGAFTLAQNHIHTIDTKVDGLSSVINSLNIEVTKLTTIIEERLPKK